MSRTIFPINFFLIVCVLNVCSTWVSATAIIPSIPVTTVGNVSLWMRVGGVIKILQGANWTDDLLDIKSEIHLDLSSKVQSLLMEKFRWGIQPWNAIDVTVIGFRKGSVEVLFSLEVSSDDQTHLFMNNTSNLKTIVLACLNSTDLGNFTIDPNSTSVTAQTEEATEALTIGEPTYTLTATSWAPVLSTLVDTLPQITTSEARDDIYLDTTEPTIPASPTLSLQDESTGTVMVDSTSPEKTTYKGSSNPTPSTSHEQSGPTTPARPSSTGDDPGDESLFSSTKGQALETSDTTDGRPSSIGQHLTSSKITTGLIVTAAALTPTASAAEPSPTSQSSTDVTDNNPAISNNTLSPEINETVKPSSHEPTTEDNSVANPTSSVTSEGVPGPSSTSEAQGKVSTLSQNASPTVYSKIVSQDIQTSNSNTGLTDLAGRMSTTNFQNDATSPDIVTQEGATTDKIGSSVADSVDSSISNSPVSSTIPVSDLTSISSTIVSVEVSTNPSTLTATLSGIPSQTTNDVFSPSGTVEEYTPDSAVDDTTYQHLIDTSTGTPKVSVGFTDTTFDPGSSIEQTSSSTVTTGGSNDNPTAIASSMPTPDYPSSDAVTEGISFHTGVSTDLVSSSDLSTSVVREGTSTLDGHTSTSAPSTSVATVALPNDETSPESVDWSTISTEGGVSPTQLTSSGSSVDSPIEASTYEPSLSSDSGVTTSVTDEPSPSQTYTSADGQETLSGTTKQLTSPTAAENQGTTAITSNEIPETASLSAASNTYGPEITTGNVVTSQVHSSTELSDMRSSTKDPSYDSTTTASQIYSDSSTFQMPLTSTFETEKYESSSIGRGFSTTSPNTQYVSDVSTDTHDTSVANSNEPSIRSTQNSPASVTVKDIILTSEEVILSTNVEGHTSTTQQISQSPSNEGSSSTTPENIPTTSDSTLSVSAHQAITLSSSDEGNSPTRPSTLSTSEASTGIKQTTNTVGWTTDSLEGTTEIPLGTTGISGDTSNPSSMYTTNIHVSATENPVGSTDNFPESTSSPVGMTGTMDLTSSPSVTPDNPIGTTDNAVETTSKSAGTTEGQIQTIISHAETSQSLTTEITVASSVGYVSHSETTGSPAETTNIHMETTDIPTTISADSPGETTDITSHSTDIPVQTTDIPDHTTDNPIETTDIPAETTDIPAETTDIPDETTPIPAETTPIAAETTQIPAETTQIFTETTEIPAETIEISADTTEIPAETTEIPAETTEIPAETTDIPAETTGITAETTPIPAETTQIPAETTQIPGESTGIPAETTEIPVESTEIPVQTTDIPAESTDFPAETTPIPAETTEIPAESTEIPADTTAIPAETTEISADTTETPAETTEISADTTEIPAETTQIPADTTQIPADTTQIPADTTAIPGETTDIPAETTEIPADTTQISAETTEIPTDTTQIPADTNEIPAETTAIPAETTQISAGTTEIPAETTEIPADTTEIPAETTEIPADTTEIPAETTQIPADTTAIPAETTAIPAETTQISDETTDIPSETTDIPSETTQILAETTAIHAVTTAIPAETTVIPAETTDIPSETTDIPSETTQILAETTAIHAVTTEIPAETTEIPAETTDIPAETTDIPAETTEIPADTTEIPADTTQIPAETTEISAETTQIPAETTEISADTTQIPAETTAIPAETTQIPADTTAIPAETTAIPAETTQISAETTDIPAEETTDIPAETTDIPAETTEIPADTTQIPAETTEISAETTQIPAETTEISADTTQIPAETTAIPAETTQIPADTTAIPAETTAIPAETTQISAETTDIPAEETTDIPAETTGIPTETTQIPAETSEILAETTGIPAETTPIPAETTDIPSETTDIPAETTGIPADTTQIPVETTEIADDTTDVPAETTVIPAETTDIPSETTEIPSETTDIPAETTGIPAETTQISADTTQISADTTQIPAETTQIPAETTQIPAETTKIPAETTQIPDDTTDIPAETTDIPAEPTEIPNDTTDVETTEIPAETTEIPAEVAETTDSIASTNENPAETTASSSAGTRDTSKSTITTSPGETDLHVQSTQRSTDMISEETPTTESEVVVTSSLIDYFHGSVKANLPWNDSYSDMSTSQAQGLKAQFENHIRIALEETPCSENITLVVKVTEFREGCVEANVEVKLLATGSYWHNCTAESITNIVRSNLADDSNGTLYNISGIYFVTVDEVTATTGDGSTMLMSTASAEFISISTFMSTSEPLMSTEQSSTKATSRGLIGGIVTANENETYTLQNHNRVLDTESTISFTSDSASSSITTSVMNVTNTYSSMSVTLGVTDEITGPLSTTGIVPSNSASNPDSSSSTMTSSLQTEMNQINESSPDISFVTSTLESTKWSPPEMTNTIITELMTTMPTSLPVSMDGPDATTTLVISGSTDYGNIESSTDETNSDFPDFMTDSHTAYSSLSTGEAPSAPMTTAVQEVNECQSNPCRNGATCEDLTYEYTCKCTSGWEGTHCDNDKDECFSPDICPKSNTLCVNEVGSYSCPCVPGYRINNDGICEDDNECLINPCPADSSCNNNIGSFSCSCEPGYEEQDASCLDLDECGDPNICSHRANSFCVNTPGDFSCQCLNGFHLNTSLDITLCSDNDECVELPCLENSFCRNTEGSYDCQCKEGYEMLDGLCRNENECLCSPCPDMNTICQDRPGSYRCLCRAGYLLTESGCLDINECENTKNCPEYSTCENLDGSYKCQCNLGRTLEDGRCIMRKKFWGVLKMNGTFHSSLSDSSSEEYKDLSNLIESEVDVLFKESTLSVRYSASIVHNFTEGSLIILLRIYFDIMADVTVSDVSEVLREMVQINNLYVDTSYTTLSDIDECSDVEWNECDLTATCSNYQGHYNCACPPSMLDISDGYAISGHSCAFIDESNQDPILDPELLFPSKYLAVGQAFNLSVTLRRGSHCVYIVTLGDSSQDLTLTNPETLAFMTPLIVPHTYNFPGNFTVFVQVSNLLSTKSVSGFIIVQNVVDFVNLNIPSKIPLPPAIVNLDISLERDNFVLDNVFVDLKYGNGEEEEISVGVLSKSQPLNIMKQYTWSSIGNVIVTVNVSNSVSHQVRTAEFVIQRRIKGVTLLVGKQYLRTGEGFNIQLNVLAGSHVFYRIDKGDETAITNDSAWQLSDGGGPLSKTIPYSYDRPGHFQISAHLWNDVSEFTVSLQNTIVVQNPLHSLDLQLVTSESHNEDLISMPDGVLEYEIAYVGAEGQDSPTEVTCLMTVDGLYATQSFQQRITHEVPMILSYKLPRLSRLKQLEVNISCQNRINNLYFSRIVLVQRRVDEVKFDTTNLNVRLYDLAEFNIAIVGGSDLIISLSYGSGEETEIMNKIEWFEDEFNFQRIHGYTFIMGDTPFQARLIVSNKVFHKEITLDIKVHESITGLGFSCYYFVSKISDVRSYGEGENGDIFPQERPVHCEAQTETGNFLAFKWNFEEAFSAKLSRNPAYLYRNPGYHSIQLEVNNAVSDSFKTQDVRIYQTVVLDDMLNDGPKAAFNAIIFTLKFYWPGTESCVRWDVGDGSPTYVYGGNECSQNLNPDDIFVLLEVVDTMYHEHTYKTEGKYNVSATAWNFLSSDLLSRTAVIRKIDCGYPQVNILGDGRNRLTPVKFAGSDWVNLESNAILNCSVSNVALFEWTVEHIVEGPNYRDEMAVNFPVSQHSTDKFQLSLPPWTFPPGVYRVTLYVYMAVLPELMTSDKIHIEISPSPLSVKIGGGSARAVGYNTLLTLDALSFTSDPDAGTEDKSGMEFEWFCFRESEALTTAANGTILDPEIEVPTVEERANLTGDGCFHTGVGKFDSSSGIVKIDTYLLEPESTNFITVQVTKGSKVGNFTQELLIIDGHPHSIAIECLDNCQSKVNPSGSLTLEAKCLSCKPADPRIFYTWSLYLLNESTDLFDKVVNLTDMVTTGISGTSLLFQNRTLIGGRIYRIRVDGEMRGYAQTFTVFEFITNLPPYGGVCNISPSSGLALITEFIIQCGGWKNHGDEDLERSPNLRYTFWSQVVGQSEFQLLYYGSDPQTPKSVFPQGLAEYDFKTNVKIRVANLLGEYVEIDLNTKVERPPADEVPIENDNEIDALLNTGKAQEAKQHIVAICSFLNIEEDVLEVKENEVTIETGTEVSGKVINGDLTTVGADDLLKQEEIRRQEELEKKQRNIQLRTEFCKKLRGSEALTPEAMQQTSFALLAATQVSEEVEVSAQNYVVEAVEEITRNLDEYVKKAPEALSKKDTYDTVSSVINVLSSAVVAAQFTFEVGAPDSGNSLLPEEPELTTPSLPSPEEEEEQQRAKKEAERQQVRSVTKRCLQMTDQLVNVHLEKMAIDEPPQVFTTPLQTIEVAVKKASDVGSESFTATTGFFNTPTVDSISGLDPTSERVATKIVSGDNTFGWDDSASFIQSGIIGFSLDQNGSALSVNNTQEPFVFQFNQSQPIEILHLSPEIPVGKTLYFREIEIRAVTNLINVIVKPDEPSVILEVYLQCNRTPDIDDYYYTTILPKPEKDIMLEMGNASTEEAEYVEGCEAEGLPEDLVEELRYTVHISSKKLTQMNVTQPGSKCYVGIRTPPNDTIPDDYDDYYVEELPEPEPTPLPNMTIQILTTGCRYWDTNIEKWSTQGCDVCPFSNTLWTRCISNHLTSFGADFIVPPNTIHFDTVFQDLGAKLADNNAVLIVLCVIIGLWVIVSLWARHKDKQDIIKWGVTPLSDNVVTENYYYQLSVYTGMRKGAGTKSLVRFILSGDKGDTGVRELKNDNKRVLERGSINHYLMSVREPLGPLSYLRIWHNNKGGGKYSSWFFDKLVVFDLQKNDTYFFICGRWLAVEEEDGMIDRTIPVAGKEDITRFSNLFTAATRKRITDSHLWVSVLSRPNRSNFTRVQRVGCILSLLFTTMIANAMFFRADEKVDQVHNITIGPLSFGVHQLWVSFVSSLIVIPVNVLIDQLFRRSVPRPTKVAQDNKGFSSYFLSKIKFNGWFSKSKGQDKPLSDSKDIPQSAVCNTDEERKSSEGLVDSIEELEQAPGVEEREMVQELDIAENVSDKKTYLKSNISGSIASLKSQTSVASSKSGVVELSQEELEKKLDENLGKTSHEGKKKKKKTLPFWCAYIAWALVFMTSLASAFFTFTYSIEWGKDRANAWLTSMMMSIVESVLLIQPGKIIIIAIIISAILKKPELEEDVQDNDSESTSTKDDEEITVKENKKTFRPSLPIDKPDPAVLQKAREERVKEVTTQRVLRHICAYLLFLSFMIFLAHQNIDTRAYHIHADMISTYYETSPSFTSIKDPPSFWRWMKEVLLPGVYSDRYYNGDFMSADGHRLTYNLVSYRVGPPRIRQLRITPGLCKLRNEFTDLFKECNEEYGFTDEQDEDFAENWKALDYNISVDDLPINYPWRYRGILEADGVPHAGVYRVYNGGGYIMDLIGSAERATNMVEKLSSSKWIDKYTRAIFIEFALFNPNVNLFTVVTLLVEFSHTNDISHSIKISTFRLYNYVGGFGSFVIFSEIVFVVCNLYFLGSIFRRLKREGFKHFFTSFWNNVDVVSSLLSFILMVVYIGRITVIHFAMKKIKRLRGAFYNFQRLAMWSEIFTAMIGILVFLGIVKIIYILRFNRRVAMLASTLKNSGREMATFSVVFIVLACAYSQFALVIFGPQLAGYKNFLTTLESIFSMLLGSFDYYEYANAEPVFGPLYFFSFIFVMVFLITNMFVSIINDTFAMVKEDVSLQSNEYEMVDFLLGRIETMTGIKLTVNHEETKKKYLTDELSERPISPIEALDQQIDDLDTHISNLYFSAYWDQPYEAEDISLHGLGMGHYVKNAHRKPTTPSYRPLME